MRALVGKWVGLRADRATVTGRICGAFAAAAVIGLAGLVPVPASMAATPGLVAAFGFNEGSGWRVADASGNGNAGTIVERGDLGGGRQVREGALVRRHERAGSRSPTPPTLHL